MNILQLAQAYAEAKVVAQAGGDVADVSRAWAALKEAARDAERYRWLRVDPVVSAAPCVWMCNEDAEPETALFGEDLDRTIDQAMQESALRRMHDLSKDIGQEL